MIQRGGPWLLAWLAMMMTPVAHAEDVTTLSGTTYREVRPVRVEPDGVVWQHATGQCKVDFTDLPEAVRRTYHYDAKRAEAFQSVQAQAHQQAIAQTQRNQREAADWRAKQLQTLTNDAATTEPGTFSVHRDPSGDPGVRSLGETMARKKAARDFLTQDDGTVWDRRLWAIPCLIFGGYSPGDHFDPHFDFGTREFQASVHHSPGGFAENSANDGFFRPDYLTKSYYKDVERAEAFARGRP